MQWLSRVCWQCWTQQRAPITRFCVDCGARLYRYTSGVRCAACVAKQTSATARKWTCVDCGAPVARRTKRCPACFPAFRSANMRQLGLNPTPERNAKVAAAVRGRTLPSLRGRKRPAEESERIRRTWQSSELREAARQRGLRNSRNRDLLAKIAARLPRREGHWNWRGGVAYLPYAPGFGKALKEIVRERDGFACQVCGRTQADTPKYRLPVHHADYDKDNHANANLFTLCRPCHGLTNHRREHWRAFFAELATRRGL